MPSSPTPLSPAPVLAPVPMPMMTNGIADTGDAVRVHKLDAGSNTNGTTNTRTASKQEQERDQEAQTLKTGRKSSRLAIHVTRSSKQKPSTINSTSSDNSDDRNQSNASNDTRNDNGSDGGGGGDQDWVYTSTASAVLHCEIFKIDKPTVQQLCLLWPGDMNKHTEVVMIQRW
jgi:hypothetical protein